MKKIYFIIIFVQLFLVGCFSVVPTNKASGGGTTTATTSSPAVISVSVVAVYPTNGANWMDWVDNDEAAKDAYSQDDVACPGVNTGGVNVCVHGGELRKVVLSGTSTCSGYSLTDNLGVFEWFCTVTTGTATFYTRGLKDGKGLVDLITATDFRTNFVTVTNSGTVTHLSDVETWWTNTVTAADLLGNSTAQITLAGAGTLYTWSGGAGSIGGFQLGASQQALVVMPGFRMDYNTVGTAKECNGAGASCLIEINNTLYNWIEGTLLAPSEVGIYGLSAHYQSIRNVYITGTTVDSLQWVASNNSRFYNVILTGSGGGGLMLTIGSKFNTFQKMRLFNNVIDGVEINPFIGCPKENVFTQLIATHNTGKGYFSNICPSSTIGFSIFAQNTLSNIRLESGTADGYTVFQTELSHTGVSGLFVNDGDSGKFSNLVFGDAGIGSGLDVRNSAGSTTTGTMIFQQDGNACNAVGASAGLTNVTCTTTGVNGSTTATGALYYSRDLSASYYGKLSAFPEGDTANTTDTNGSDTFNANPAIFDQVNFDNEFRTWGLTAGTGDCQGGVCHIFDWRINSTDTNIRDTSEDGTYPNTAFVDGGTCGSPISSNDSLTDSLTTPNTFLINAMEITWDHVGDEDGLCESNERCIYQPNYGAYMGEGELNESCTTASAGNVQNAVVFKYSQNGAI